MIIPLSRPITARTFPYCTLAFVMINVFVFCIFQRLDTFYEERALDYYVDSGLLQIEYAAYTDYKKETQKNLADGAKYVLIKTDSDFEWKLLHDNLIPPTAEIYPTWKEHRDHYEHLLQKSTTTRWGLSTDKPRWIQFFTHMFLHGGWDHLLGNMIFLWLAGCLLEQGCGALVLALVYFGGGLFAAGLFLLTLPAHAVTTLVGASGAISGIMGAVTTLYGRQRIKIFLMLGFYFNSLRVPAIALLPIWIGYEFFNSIQYGATSNVAYMAHVGGLVGGAFIGFVLQRFFTVTASPEREETPVDPLEKRFTEALQATRDLRFEQAQSILQEILHQDPKHLRALQQLFIVTKTGSDAKAIAHAGQNLLERLLATGADSAGFALYQELAERKALPAQPKRQLAVANMLIRQEQWTELEKILALFLHYNPTAPQAPVLLLQLARGLHRAGKNERSQRCLRLLATKYPHSQEAALAQKALAN